ncbi:MAG: ferritin-like domain-containing protein [Actinomycetota bacterium]|nr:ferritin-like domain-containing protein [Actinomycetota bacterium]
MSPATVDPLVHRLQEVLAGEHAALYAYSVIGGRLDPDSPVVARAVASYEAHRSRRDRLALRLRDLGERPVVAEPGYALPLPVQGVPSAAVLAQRVEDRCAVLYASLVATAPAATAERSLGSTSLVDASTRALGWGAPTTAFPGVARP